MGQDHQRGQGFSIKDAAEKGISHPGRGPPGGCAYPVNHRQGKAVGWEYAGADIQRMDTAFPQDELAQCHRCGRGRPGP